MSLYKKLVENISIALIQSLNEMARVSPVRTIDRKLWLTVASACSRNRSTEAEFVKPVGNDKDNLVQRYVAALLIMKKPCPETVQDVEQLKTFKLVAKKAFQMGATIEDIQNLYKQNSDTSQAQKQPKQQEQQPQTNKEQKQDKVGLFDDDLFGDDSDYFETDTNLANTIAGFDPNTKLNVVLTNLIGLDKPRGFKLYKPGTECEYESAIQESEVYLSNKYVRDFERLLQAKKWTEITIPTLTRIYDQDFESHTRDQVIKIIENNVSSRQWDEERKDETVNEQIAAYDQWVINWNKFYNRLTDKFEKDFFKNKYIKKAYISPDRGMIYYVQRIPYTGTTTYYYGKHVLTFTGEVSYNSLMNNDVTRKDAVNKVKLERQCLAKYKEFLRNTVHILFSGAYKMYDGRPVCFCSMDKNSMKTQIRWFSRHFGEPTNDSSNPKAIMEYKYKNADKNGDYVRVLFKYDSNHEFGPHDVAIITYLTDKGLQKFNNYYMRKYESILRI